MIGMVQTVYKPDPFTIAWAVNDRPYKPDIHYNLQSKENLP